MSFQEVLLSIANPASMNRQLAKVITVLSRLKNKFLGRVVQTFTESKKSVWFLGKTLKNYF